MAESVRVNFNELSLEPLEPDKLRKLVGLAYEVGATPLYVHGCLTVEMNDPGFVIVAAGEAQGGEMPKLRFAVLRRVECFGKAGVCFDWDVGMGQIEAQQVFCHLQSAGPGYDSPVFRYCPWCGARLLECGKSEEEKMPKPRLAEPYRTLERQIIETMYAGLGRSGLKYPESYSDMQAAVRGLLEMFEVTRHPLPFQVPEEVIGG